MPQYPLKDGTSTTDVRLDRIPAFDPQSLNFRIRAALDESQQQTLWTRNWNAPAGTPVLDQGQEGACTGFGVTNELLWNPVPVPALDAAFAREKIYWPAQEGDPWPGGAYPGANPHYDGTAVLFAIKAAVSLGYYTEYRWGTSEAEMALGLSHLGPAVIGIDWYRGMFTPNSGGFLRLTGGKAGGHCILVTGINVNAGYYTVHNSWGPTWGVNGDAKIRRDDMAELLAADGECCIITGRSIPHPAQEQQDASAEAPNDAENAE